MDSHRVAQNIMRSKLSESDENVIIQIQFDSVFFKRHRPEVDTNFN